MKKLTLSCIALMLSLICFSQNPTFSWIKNVAWGVNYQSIDNIEFGSSGEIYAAGTYLTNNRVGDTAISFEGNRILRKKSLGFHTWFGKFDNSAKPLWISGFNCKRRGFVMEVDKDGNFYLANKTGDTTSAYGLTLKNNVPFILKFDQNGNFLRADTFSFGASTDAITSVQVDDSLNMYVAGYTSLRIDIQGQRFPRIGSTDAFLFKLDSKGKLLWGKIFGGKSQQDGISDMVLDSEGNVFIVGTCVGNTSNRVMMDTISLLTAGKDYYLAKIHPATGAVLWVRTSNQAGGEDSGNSLTIDENDNLYITGSFGGGTAFSSEIVLGSDTIRAFLSNIGRTEQTGFTAKYNSDGDAIWGQYFGGGGSTSGSILEYQNGRLTLTGNLAPLCYLNHGKSSELRLISPEIIRPGYNFISDIDSADGSFLNGRPMALRQAAINDIEIYGSQLYVTGNFKESYHFGADSIMSVGGEDAFIGVIGDLDYAVIPAPSNLAVLASTMNSQDISWVDNSSNEDGFAIVHGAEFGSGSLWPPTDVNFTGANATSYSIGMLQPNLAYDKVVFAHYNYEIFSDSSNTSLDSTVVKVGWKELDQPKLTVFPNPVTTGELNVLYEGKLPASYQILNMQGQDVRSGRLSNAQSMIELAQLPSGSYMLNVNALQQTWRKHIIVSN